MGLILYQRDDCHLCDLALDVLAAARVPDFQSAFIDDEMSLEHRYGLRVPVLRDRTSGRELDWPFDADAVRRFVATGREGDDPG
jgi:hypothetical protein